MSIYSKELDINKYGVTLNKPFEWIVTGLPRSGTFFGSTLLGENGIPCDHENFFGYRLLRGRKVSTDSTSESSWIAALFLRDLWAQNILILVRNPIELVTSQFKLNGFSKESRETYTRVVYSVCPAVEKENNKIDRSLRFYIEWNKMIVNNLKDRDNYMFIDSTFLFNSQNIHLFQKKFKVPQEKVNSRERRKKQLNLDVSEEDIKNSYLFEEANELYELLTLK